MAFLKNNNIENIAKKLSARKITLIPQRGLGVGIAILIPAVATISTTLVLTITGVYLHTKYNQRSLKQKAEKRRRETDKRISNLRDILQGLKIDDNLTKLSYQDIWESLQNGKVSATDVLRAYQVKALQVNERTNAITDIIESATKQAAYLDSLAADQRGPLHGIPISVKETCGLKGADCTGGFPELIDIHMEQDSFLIQVLKSKGAVPFIRTNLPEGMRSFSCDNLIYGDTVNPHNPKRGPGGSSGGEGAMIGGGGSILGIGSDVGGSIRIPAAFSGCCSFKPTSDRLGHWGNFSHGSFNGQNLVTLTDGPLGKDVNSLVHFMRATLTSDLRSLEPSIPRVPFDEQLFNSQQPLRIGFFVNNGCTLPVPAIERAVYEAKTALETLGHHLVDFDVKSYMLEGISEIFVPCITADDGAMFKELMRYDSGSPSMKSFYQASRMPYWMGWVLSKIIPYDPLLSASLKRRHFKSIDDWFKFCVFVQEFRQNFAQEMKKEQLDLLLCPSMPCPALTTGVDVEAPSLASYTGFWNVVNFPAGVVPVTQVTQADVDNTQKSYPAKTLLEKLIQKDAEGSQGLPVTVQLVGLPYMDEMVLRTMAQLETNLKTGNL